MIIYFAVSVHLIKPVKKNIFHCLAQDPAAVQYAASETTATAPHLTAAAASLLLHGRQFRRLVAHTHHV